MNWRMGLILVVALLAAIVLYIGANVGIGILAPIVIAGIALAWLMGIDRRKQGHLR